MRMMTSRAFASLRSRVETITRPWTCWNGRAMKEGKKNQMLRGAKAKMKARKSLRGERGKKLYLRKVQLMESLNKIDKLL